MGHHGAFKRARAHEAAEMGDLAVEIVNLVGHVKGTDLLARDAKLRMLRTVQIVHREHTSLALDDQLPRPRAVASAFELRGYPADCHTSINVDVGPLIERRVHALDGDLAGKQLVEPARAIDATIEQHARPRASAKNIGSRVR